MSDVDIKVRQARIIAAARQLHDAIGCFYGDFTAIDSEYGDDVYEAARLFVAEYEKR